MEKLTEAVVGKIAHWFSNQFAEKEMDAHLITEVGEKLTAILVPALNENNVMLLQMNTARKQCSGIIRAFMNATHLTFKDFPDFRFDMDINLNRDSLVLLSIEGIKPIPIYTIDDYERSASKRRISIPA